MLPVRHTTALNYLSLEDYRRFCGLFVTFNYTPKSLPDGCVWAMDNGCFNKYDPDKIKRALKRHSGSVSNCLFAVLPDKVGDSKATRLLYHEWLDAYKAHGYKVAYVLQDGESSIPENIDTVFIGGSTKYKLSYDVRRLVEKAKERGLYVHMGRVNSVLRIRYARSIGCDSIDGTNYFIDKQAIKTHLPHFKSEEKMLWEKDM
jgi:hypothetical protein